MVVPLVFAWHSHVIVLKVHSRCMTIGVDRKLTISARGALKQDPKVQPFAGKDDVLTNFQGGRLIDCAVFYSYR